MGLTVATWNINSVRLRIDNVRRLIAEVQPDVLCLQETKTVDETFPREAFEELGYRHMLVHGMKSYNGVATLTLREPERVMYGLEDGPDSEDTRILQTVVDGIPIVNTYVPQGYKVGSDKYAFKLRWFIATSSRDGAAAASARCRQAGSENSARSPGLSARARNGSSSSSGRSA